MPKTKDACPSAVPAKRGAIRLSDITAKRRQLGDLGRSNNPERSNAGKVLHENAMGHAMGNDGGAEDTRYKQRDGIFVKAEVFENERGRSRRHRYQRKGSKGGAQPLQPDTQRKSNSAQDCDDSHSILARAKPTDRPELTHRFSATAASLLEDYVRDVTAEHAASHERSLSALREKCNLEKVILERDSRIQMLERTVHGYEMDYTALYSKYLAEIHEREATKGELTKSENAIKQLQRMLLNYCNEAEAQRRKIFSLDEAARAHCTRARQLEDRFLVQTEGIKTQAANIESLARTVNRGNVNIHSLQESLTTYRKEIDAQAQQVEALRKAVNSGRTYIRELENKAMAQTKTEKRQADKISILAQTVNDRDDEIKSHRETVVSQLKKNEALEEQNKAQEKQIKGHRNRIQGLQETVHLRAVSTTLLAEKFAVQSNIVKDQATNIQALERAIHERDDTINRLQRLLSARRGTTKLEADR
ncbi:hypothetical protein BDW74DRAFT_172853 [Aspergillus multicolor]|uniref:uncharacterized protein n=1 Tax=Aspergillus multicolor TaxID=41759 RepID=UPI003CCDFD38